MHTKNEEELLALGERLGHLLQKDDVLILTGELGAGKTTFTKGLAKGLDIRQMIKSPTSGRNDEWLFDFDAIEQAFANGCHAFVLCNPHNQIGRAHV